MKKFFKKIVIVLEKYYAARAEEQIRIKGWL
jgi:hypothetical protein